MKKLIGLERLSKDAIEQRSVKLLTHFDTNFFSSPHNTPLIKISEFLTQTHGIQFSYDGNLGFTDDGKRLLGIFLPQKKTIFIDVALRPDERKFNFTLAHEMGHLALHRKLSYEEGDFCAIDVEENLSENKSDTKSDYEWMEWQANYYSGCLLMPMQQFRFAILQIKKELGLRNTEAVFVDNQPSVLSDYYNITFRLAAMFQVSRTAVEIRLRQLNLIDDRRNSFKTASDCVLEILRNTRTAES